MGTTVTTNLGLIKPDLNEKVKEDLPTFAGWAAQNAANCEVIDGLFRNDLDTYTPTLTASTSNPTLGSGGSVSGKYVRLFPRLVIAEFHVDFGGAGFGAGSGFYQLTLPVAMDSDLISTLHNSFPVGMAYLHDNDAAATSTSLVTMYSVSLNTLFFRPPGGAVWNNTAPMTLAQNDKLSGYAIYPTEAA